MPRQRWRCGVTRPSLTAKPVSGSRRAAAAEGLIPPARIMGLITETKDEE
jgi:hypothetical protein